MKKKDAVIIEAAMASKQNVLFLIIVLVGLIWSCQGQREEITDAIRNIFLTKPINSSEGEGILKSARESFSFLKGIEKQGETSEKSNFAKNYANFLTELFEHLRTKDIDVGELFSRQNAFLKDYNATSTVGNVNITAVHVMVENFQTAVERLLIPYYNSSSELYDAQEILNLESESSRFDAFLKEKLRADYCEIGYFFLEVFATLIGLSWGIISTAVHVAGNVGSE